MAPSVITIEQNFINMPNARLQVETIFETDLSTESITGLLNLAPSVPRAVGLAPGYTPAGLLTVLAIAVNSKVLLVQFRSKSKKDTDPIREARQTIQRELFGSTDNVFFAFNMAILAATLYLDTGLRVEHAVDIQDGCSCKENRVPANAVEFALNTTKHRAYKANISAAFEEDVWDPARPATTSLLALKAWLSGFLPGIADMEERFREVAQINLTIEKWPDVTLSRYAQWARTDQQLDFKKAGGTSHEYSAVSANRNKYEARGERFQNRLRASNGPVQMSIVDSTGAQYTIPGRVHDVQGRSATVKASGLIEGKTVISLASTVRDGPTMAEKDKAAALLRIFQEKSKVSQNCFLRTIWPDGKELVWPESMLTTSDTPPIVYDSSPLNNSQQAAVNQMLQLTNSSRITLNQGPPGSGKTTVIAAFVHSATAAGLSGIWLVAQSNVAVKNIAEKLLKSGFTKWKLLLSKDFHAGWHEHLYDRISSYVIRSDEYSTASRELQDCQVILCTLSTLAHPRLNIFTRKVPIKTMVIDEASQINVNDYIPILERFSSLYKLCFIGDDKQLPPYGQGEIQELQSIFEIPHLRSNARFLDTQYRMPPHIGDFISDAVYDGQLKSNPEHEISDHACWFVDVANGVEKRNGTSWENRAECEGIITLARFLQEEEASYRIITPYDPQRTAIENRLQAAELLWQDKVFNVDSFQGNEDDVIIISVVRTAGLGFLEDLRRTNVMLTRCKKAMYIFSSWEFLVNGPGANCLVGRMAAHFGDQAWLSMAQIAEGNF